MTARDTLPLGVDIGTTRVRVALAERSADGAPQLARVATRPTGDDAAAALAAAHAELRTRERRCVLGIGAPDALLRLASFPSMRAAERARTARFEAARHVAYPLDEAVVRLADTGDGRYAVGIARGPALDALSGTARRARLRPVAVDDVAFALVRAFPHAGAIVDAGERATLLVVPAVPLPAVRRIGLGGGALTAAIVASLGLSAADAERRKRTLGLAGAGEHVRDALIDELAAALTEHRASARTEIRTIVLTGNAARLAGFAEMLEAAVAVPVRIGELASHAHSVIPADVLRAASPDWALAYGLATWSAAA